MLDPWLSSSHTQPGYTLTLSLKADDKYIDDKLDIVETAGARLHGRCMLACVWFGLARPGLPGGLQNLRSRYHSTTFLRQTSFPFPSGPTAQAWAPPPPSPCAPRSSPPRRCWASCASRSWEVSAQWLFTLLCVAGCGGWCVHNGACKLISEVQLGGQCLGDATLDSGHRWRGMR